MEVRVRDVIVVGSSFVILLVILLPSLLISNNASNLGATDENVNTTTSTTKEDEKDVDPTNPSVEKKEEGVENSSQTLITSSRDGVEEGGGIERSTTDLWPENPIRISGQVNRGEEKSQGSIRGQEAAETGF